MNTKIILAIVAAIVLAAATWIWSMEPDPRGVLAAAIKPVPLGIPPKTTKPICSQMVVPTGDCIPQHLAKLPPDPGEAGKATLAGIDSDKDGTRDDVQIWLAQNYGHSERTLRALTKIAQHIQLQVEVGATIKDADAAHALALTFSNAIDCYFHTVDEKIRDDDKATARLETKVHNTDARLRSWARFENLLAWRGFPAMSPYATVADVCGYDPATLPN